MESWSFDSMDKGFVLNEAISPYHSIIRDQNIVMEWDLKPPLSFENSVLVPIQKSVHNSSFPEVGIADMIRKQIPHNSTRNVLGDNASVGDIISPSLATSNVISEDKESSSRFSSSVLDSNSRESSLIDLKLGGFGDNSHSNSTSTANILSSADSSAPSKRARLKSLNSQTTYCQVYGCQKDLISAKVYLRRHKVCDVHSKSPKVIVNGVEQRFCQQCSRFHLLGEFDGAKRSCRKRLAGHNERRRKPPLGFSSRNERSFHSYTGSNFQKFSSTPTSFTCQGISPRGTSQSYADLHASNDWIKHIKVENETDYTQKPTYNCLYGKLQPKPMFSSYIFEKRFPFPDNTNNTGPQNPLMVDAESGFARSLLSSQLRKSSDHSSQIPEPEVIPSGSPHYIVNEVSEDFFGIQNRNSLCWTNSTGRNQQTSMLKHHTADTPHNQSIIPCGHPQRFSSTPYDEDLILL